MSRAPCEPEGHAQAQPKTSPTSTITGKASDVPPGRAQPPVRFRDLPPNHRREAMLVHEAAVSRALLDLERTAELEQIDCSTPPCIWHIEFDVEPETAWSDDQVEDEILRDAVLTLLEAETQLGAPRSGLFYGGDDRAIVVAWWAPADLSDAEFLALKAGADDRIEPLHRDSIRQVLIEMGMDPEDADRAAREAP